MTLLGKDLAKEAYEEYKQYLLNDTDKISLNDRISDLLEFCNNNSINTILVANQDPLIIEPIIEKYDISSLFDSLIFHDDSESLLSQIQLIIDSLQPDSKRESLLFITNSIKELSFAFRSRCIPIFITQNGTYIDNDLQLLLSSNLDNPIGIIQNSTYLLKFLEKTNENWSFKEEISKIVLIGAGGNIGKQSIPKICDSVPDNESAEIVLIGSGNDASLSRLKGFSEDISGSFNCCTKQRKNIKFTVTNDYISIKYAKIVCCSAGRWPSPELSKKFSQIDPTGRTKQSFVNKEMIENIAYQVQLYSPDCLLVLVTNQVDMMCAIARLKVLGLS